MLDIFVNQIAQSEETRWWIELLDLLLPFIGVIVGAGLAYIFQIRLENIKTQNQRESVRQAIKNEIEQGEVEINIKNDGKLISELPEEYNAKFEELQIIYFPTKQYEAHKSNLHLLTDEETRDITHYYSLVEVYQKQIQTFFPGSILDLEELEESLSNSSKLRFIPRSFVNDYLRSQAKMTIQQLIHIRIAREDALSTLNPEDENIEWYKRIPFPIMLILSIVLISILMVIYSYFR